MKNYLKRLGLPVLVTVTIFGTTNTYAGPPQTVQCDVAVTVFSPASNECVGAIAGNDMDAGTDLALTNYLNSATYFGADGWETLAKIDTVDDVNVQTSANNYFTLTGGNSRQGTVEFNISATLLTTVKSSAKDGLRTVNRDLEMDIGSNTSSDS